MIDREKFLFRGMSAFEKKNLTAGILENENWKFLGYFLRSRNFEIEPTHVLIAFFFFFGLSTSHQIFLKPKYTSLWKGLNKISHKGRPEVSLNKVDFFFNETLENQRV